MREIFDCAVLSAAGLAFAEAGTSAATPDGRLRLHPFALDASPPAEAASLLAEAALRLQRYDACILPVASATLPWARTALARARAVLRTPVLVLAHDCKAAALFDLLELGAADFLRAPLCPEELRARLMRLASRPAMQEPDLAYGKGGRGGEGAGLPPACPEPPHIPLSRFRAGHVRPHPGVVTSGDPTESFRQAKARVVEGFEREYLRRALARHEGNVARAARASRKHRRAFWALMRKHGIDAAPYREAARAAWAADG